MLTTTLHRAVVAALAPALLLAGAPLRAARAQDAPAPARAPAPERPPAPEKSPAPAKAPAAAPPVLDEAAEGGITGRLFALDGTTPLKGRELVLRNAKGVELARVASGEDGSFRLPDLVTGDYVLECDGAAQALEVRRDRPLHALKVLLPAEGKADGLQAIDASTILWVGAGAAVVILAGVGGGILGYNLRDSDSDPAPTSLGMAFETSPSGDFGAVQVNQGSQRTFILRNLSSIALQGTLSSTSSQFTITSGTSFSIPAGGTAPVTVRFQPTVAASHIGTLDAVVTNVGGVPPASKPLFGSGSTTPVSPSNP